MPLKKGDVKSSSKKPLKKGDVKSSSKKPLKKGGVKSSSKKPLKKEGVKSSSKMPLKKRGGTDKSMLAFLGKNASVRALAEHMQDASVRALAERMQDAPPPKSALEALHSQLQPLDKPSSMLALLGKNASVRALAEGNRPKSALEALHSRLPPLEKPQRAKTVNVPSLKLQGLIKRLHEPQYKSLSLMRLIKILHRTKNIKPPSESMKRLLDHLRETRYLPDPQDPYYVKPSPLENPPRAKTVNGESLKGKGLQGLIKILHRTKNKEL